MKKVLLILVALFTVVSAMAFPKAIYVKKGDEVKKFNFGVAEDLVFSNDGRTLTITGYDEDIKLDEIDYISFSAPVDGTAITPNAQKDKLIQIGEELNSIVNLNDLAELVRMYNNFFIEEYDEDTYTTTYTPPVEYEIPAEYYDVHNAANAILKAVGKIGKGQFAAVRDARAAATELYKFADYTRIYTANAEKRMWEKTGEADYFEMRFAARTSGTYAVRIDASSDYSTWESTESYTIQAPKTLTFTLRKDQTKLAEATLKSEFVNKSHIDLDFDFSANGYVVKNKMNVVNDKITDVVDVTIKGNFVTHAETAIDGENLVDFDAIRDDAKRLEDIYDDDYNIIEEADPNMLLAHILRAKSDVDLLGKIQFKGHLSGLSKIYNTLAKDTWTSQVEKDGYGYHRYIVSSHNDDYTEINIDETDREIVAEQVNVLNNYCSITFSYDKNAKIQGYCVWDTATEFEYNSELNIEDRDNSNWGYAIVNGELLNVERESSNSNDWYYEKYPIVDGYFDYSNAIRVPVSVDQLLGNAVINYYENYTSAVLTFPDMTSFSFEEYFDEASFRKLIDDYNVIVNTYETITGQK